MSLPRPFAATVLGFAAALTVAACSPAPTAGAAPSAPAKRPNILLIVADDLGYSDLGSYGGEIATPNIDALAAQGIKFTNFYGAPTCSTTRSMLLSGVDSHRNGLGALDEGGVPVKDAGPGYEGHLNFDVTTLPALLRTAGYHTYMAGKWHLGNTPETGPHARGFERSFGILGGSAAHFGRMGAVSRSPIARYFEDGKPVEVPQDFFSSRNYTDKLIEYLESNAGDGQPFFVYAAYTAPHWPIQAPQEKIDKYAGTYDGGYDAIRAKRIARLKQLGLLDRTPPPAEPGAAAKSWAALSPAQRERETRLMQVYAGLVDSLDENIGRLIDHLRDSGQLDNTVIIFMSDNGPEGNDPYQILDNATWVPKAWKTDTASLGQPGAFASYGPGWAEVSATPFRFYKAFTGEGGIRVPGIFVLPGHKAAGRIERNVGTVLDIMPSVLEMAGVSYPRTDEHGRALLPLDGTSLLPLLTSRTPVHSADDGIGWELFGRRALLLGDWKLLWVDEPYGTGEWQLFDLASDPFERRDLAGEKPAKLREMLEAWRAYMRRSNVKLMDYSGLQYGKINEHYEH